MQGGGEQPSRGSRAAAGGGSYDPDLVLLIDRITGGFSLDEYAHAESLGYDAYLAEQLNYESLIGANDPELQGRLTAYDIQNMSSQEIYDAYQPDNMSIFALLQTTTIQVIWSTYAKAQLYYRLIQFWNHHLSIDILSSNAQRFIMWAFLRDVVATFAMDNVPDLIRASAKGPAMLYYLNNNTNVAAAPNENYARELMELHTLGVDNGYTEDDVRELARILTGWSVCFNPNNGCNGGTLEYGDFYFIAGNHDTGNKMFLGEEITGMSGPGAVAEGEEALTILTEHENTADYIARKMIRFFIGGTDYNYNPPEDIVQMVKWTYLNSSPIGDIRSMLSVILSRDVLTNVAVPKFRRPFDLTTAAVRAVGGDLNVVGQSYLNDLGFHLQNMGMYPNFWGPPNGPYDSKSWSEGSIIPRWQFVDELSRNLINEMTNFSVGTLLASIDATAPGTQAQGINEILTGNRMTDKEVEAIQEFIGNGSPSEARLKEALGLAMSLPTYQSF